MWNGTDYYNRETLYDLCGLSRFWKWPNTMGSPM